MLSYQHAYHAGNFADVHKHLTLYAVQDHLLRKKSAVTYIDTHAGRGLYPLAAKEALKLQEHREGIDPLWQARAQVSDPLLAEWLSHVASVQPDAARLSHYPGSPWWLARGLREQDALRLCELHPGEHAELDTQALPEAAVRVYGDGLEELERRVPVKTPRLCVLIDPSFELKTEYQAVADSVVQAMEKARHAVIMIWYPLLPSGAHHTLLETLKGSGVRKIWQSELFLREPGGERHGMYASGMLVVNPPWGLDERMRSAMREITALLGNESRFDARWLVEE
ncbi:23S rRNA (adenine(2030)-N(6))-methyltransferase RlmJ [Halomonas aquamarina]|uniref:23S rRNA (Adenine(2030)-N(6))-methyltransferase RlmJ n=1 Tax=Vreelandella aquamarina TaxID=77097 RepID=A0ACC5VU78_9GAMM|nr:23S rRNA (adenine(2030)-N(6))-methyltransferase RlmJ [Halomonas aquamarina]MBZ5487425.1 23S rRNA (adenine(2030)-N(6))-methyltransferase RlmJ [Halomonas aquamarina]